MKYFVPKAAMTSACPVNVAAPPARPHARALLGALTGLFLATNAWSLTIGPDSFGYIATNDVAYNFIDISSTGTGVLAGTDDSTVLANIGFAFPFYGSLYSQVYFSPNGLLTFGGARGDYYAYPFTGGISFDLPAIAPMWNDLQFFQPGSGRVYYQTIGAPGTRTLIVQWHEVFGYHSSPQGMKFQVLLFEDTGAIMFQYLDANSGDHRTNGAYATVGIRATGGHVSGRYLQWSSYSAGLSDGMAILITQGCGNGDLDPGEACDDGNLTAGDCCSATCQAEPAGLACASDTNTCTNDACDGNGNCAHSPNTAACNDGNACTLTDVCANGQCTAGNLVVSCSSGDGCCIPGCTASQDSDCPALQTLDYISRIVDDSIDPMNGINGLHEGRDVAVSPDGLNVYVASYADHALAVFSRDPETGAVSWVETEMGANSALSRAQTVVVSPDGMHVYAGNDSGASSGLSLFNRDPGTGALTYVAAYRQAGLVNVMKIAISADGLHVYAASASNLLVTYQRNPLTGGLNSVQTLEDGVDGVDGLANARYIAISADGAHVYATGTNDHAVSIFSRDPVTGLLTYVTALFDDTTGYAFLHRADGVAVSGDGQFVYISSFDEDLNVFARDAVTGLLTFVQRFPQAGGPGALVVSPDDGRIYTSSWVIALDAFGRDLVSSTHAFLETKLDDVDGVDGIGGLQGIAISPDGMDVYTGSATDRALAHFRVRCGNGSLDVGEGCDDGNGAGGDGCASNCAVEFCWTCTAVPFVESVCTPDEGKSCDDGLFCTGVAGDSCQAGVCTGSERTCDDNNQCTEDTCDESANGCVNDSVVLDGTSCDDGAFCNVGEACLAGTCQAGAAIDCDDGQDCTLDGCDEVGDSCIHPPKADGTTCASGAACTVAETCTSGACAGGSLDASSCADHFLCYKSKVTADTPKFVPIEAVPLADRFETTAVDVKKPVAICTPADNNGEGIADDDVHLESFLVKTTKDQPKHAPRTGLTVTDQFGTIAVDTLKVQKLMVPTALALGGPAPALASPKLSHYECYGVKLSAGSPQFPSGLQATIDDRFTEAPVVFDVRKPKSLCVPVDMDDSGIVEPLAHLMCYQVRRGSNQPRHVGITDLVHTLNSLGSGRLDTIKEDTLCVPGLVEEAP